MAYSLALIVTLIAVANAGYVWVDEPEQGFNPFSALKMVFPRYPKPPRYPQASGFPFLGLGLNMPMPKLPTVQDILDTSPKPGQVYNGVVAKSSSTITRDKDGKPVRSGGTVVVMNNNGETQKYETGDKPPNVNDPIVFPPFFKL